MSLRISASMVQNKTAGSPLIRNHRPFCCGGLHCPTYPLRRLPRIELRFEPTGPLRWPFGYKILRKFRYPWNYPVPEDYRDLREFTETIDSKKQPSLKKTD